MCDIPDLKLANQIICSIHINMYHTDGHTIKMIALWPTKPTNSQTPIIEKYNKIDIILTV